MQHQVLCCTAGCAACCGNGVLPLTRARRALGAAAGTLWAMPVPHAASRHASPGRQVRARALLEMSCTLAKLLVWACGGQVLSSWGQAKCPTCWRTALLAVLFSSAAHVGWFATHAFATHARVALALLQGGGGPMAMHRSPPSQRPRQPGKQVQDGASVYGPAPSACWTNPAGMLACDAAAQGQAQHSRH